MLIHGAPLVIVEVRRPPAAPYLRQLRVDRKGPRHYIEGAAFVAGPSGQAVT